MTVRQIQKLAQIKLKRADIQIAIEDERWQTFRMSMKGTPTEIKLDMLCTWFEESPKKKLAIIQIVNYYNALKRGGLV